MKIEKHDSETFIRTADGAIAIPCPKCNRLACACTAPREDADKPRVVRFDRAPSSLAATGAE